MLVYSECRGVNDAGILRNLVFHWIMFDSTIEGFANIGIWIMLIICFLNIALLLSYPVLCLFRMTLRIVRHFLYQEWLVSLEL